MLLSNDFEVAQPVDKVWAFFGDVPQVAACLPGAQLDQDLGDDTYAGGVGLRMGPVRLEFDGRARIVERDDQAKRMVIDASGADRKGRGQASMTVTGISPRRMVRLWARTSSACMRASAGLNFMAMQTLGNST